MSNNSFGFYADVEFSAVVDPNTELAHQRIADLQKGKFAEKWSKTKVFPHYRELLNSPVRFNPNQRYYTSLPAVKPLWLLLDAINGD